jgi:predicted site-specific integrase-resolvase
MSEANVISFSAAAERKGCARSTLYRAAKDGRLNTAEVGSVTMILRDESWDSFEPERRGPRARSRPSESVS